MKFSLIFFFIFTLYNSQYLSTWYNTDNNLPNSIKDIIKDRHGFIWLSSNNGLVKYDGQNFRTFTEFPISNIFFDNFLGNIENDSIIVYNNYEKEKILIQGRVPKVLNRKINRYKLLSKKNGIYIRKITKNVLVNKYENYIQYFIKLKYGTYTFGKNSIIYTESKKKDTKISIPFTNEDLYNIFVKDDILYITDPKNRKTYYINKGNLGVSPAPTLLNDPLTQIYWHQTTGQTLLINKNSIYILEKKDGKNNIKFLVENKELENHPVNSLYYDENFNRLYLGTTNNGLNIIDLGQFNVARDSSLFANNVFYASIPFSKNTVVTGNGIEFSKEGVKKRYPFGKQGKYCLFYDNKKNIMFPNKGYIIKIKKQSNYWKSDSLYVNLNLDGIFKSNSLYAYSTTDFIKNNYLYIFKNDEFKKPDYVYKFKGIVTNFMQYGEFILVGCTNGLYQIDLAHNKQKIFPGITVKNILKTIDGNTWITTNKDGFFLLRNGKLIKMPNDSNNFLESAHYMMEDKNGNYWISSNNGLFKVQKKQLLQYANNKSTIVHYYRFSKSDGLLTNELNSSAANILSDGDFVFPSMNGFIFFNPNMIKSYYPSKKNIYIENVKIDCSKATHFTGDLKLKNDYKTAEILIEVPYYADQDNLYIEAKLNNTKYSDWERLKTNKYIIKGVEPGEYELQFRILISPDGKFSYKTVKIIIEPRFYQTILFKILMIILCISFLMLIIKIRINLLKSKNISLEKIVSEKEDVLKKTSEDLEVIRKMLDNETEYQKKIIETISHDIATPLKYLLNLSKNLNELEDIQSQKKYLNSIYKSSKEIYKFTLNLKEYSALYRDDKIHEETAYSIFDLAETKRNLFHELALLNNTIIYNKVDQSIRSNINKNIILAVIHNLLDNSIKNTKSGTITIEGNSVNETVEIKISDTGTGMSKEQIEYYMNMFENFGIEDLSLKKYGLGLHMVVYFIKKINAEISFSKNKPNGTVTLIVIRNR